VTHRPEKRTILSARRIVPTLCAVLSGWSLGGTATSFAAPDTGWRKARSAIDRLAAQVVAELEAGQARDAPAPEGEEAGFDLVKRTHAFYRDLVTLDLTRTVAWKPSQVQTARVRRNNASVWPQPAPGHPRFARAAKGSRVYVLAAHDGWREVLFTNGTVGWMHVSDLLTGPTLLTADEREAFLRAALRHRGIRYLWGGSSDHGVDCSGLVYRVLRSFGIRPPRTAARQYRLGVPVSRGGLRRGDLVFFRNTYKPGISHVGIYLGDNRFLHASSGRGKVTVGKLDEGYYAAHYAGARRLFAGGESQGG